MLTKGVIYQSDYAFIQYCYQKYKVDQVSYHVIDSSFYQYGLDERVERRKHLLDFFDYIIMKNSSVSSNKNPGVVKLKQEMQEYLEESFILLHMREMAIS